MSLSHVLHRRVIGALIVGLIAIGLVVPSTSVAQMGMARYPVSVKIDITATQRSIWQGVKPGCHAPQENVDVAYTWRIRTHPNGAKSAKLAKPVKVVMVGGATNLQNGTYAVPTFFGAPGGFVQSGRSGAWDLEVNYPPSGCGTDPPPPVPPEVTSPTCNRIAGRAAVTLQPAEEPGRNGDGSLIIHRVHGPKLTSLGAAIKPGCFRTLHDVSFATRESEFSVKRRTTTVQLPLPGLHRRLANLATLRNPKPIVYPVRFSGDCWNVTARPDVGLVRSFRPVQSAPHFTIGNPEREGVACMLSGRGTVTITRTGPQTVTRIPSKIPRGIR